MTRTRSRSRSRRSARASRALASFVIAAVATGAAVQIHRMRAERAAAHLALAAAASHAVPIHPALRLAAATPTVPPAPPAAPPPLLSTTPLISTTPSLADATGARSSVIPAMAFASVASSETPAPASLLAASPRPASLLATPSTQPNRSASTLLAATARPANPGIATPPPVPAATAGTGATGGIGAASASFTPHPLSDAQTQFADGNLLTARKILNDALVSSALSPADAQTARDRIAQINQTVIFSSEKFPDDPYGGIVTVRPGQRLSTIAAQHGITWQLLLQLNNLSDPRRLRAGQTLKVIQGPFQVVVTKHTFTMDLYLGSTPGSPGSMYVRSYPIGLGKDDSTPTGTWMIANRVKHPTYYSPRGEGVIAADDPQNPLGPCWMGLTGTDGHAVGKQSYGIHGTIDPASIGHMSSMGCIRMHNEDVAVVFNLLSEGKSTVTVRD